MNVEVYVPNPLRCYNCQFFGHHERRCTRKKYVQTVERLVDWGLTSHQQLRSYGDGTSVCSPIRRTGEPATPGLHGEWHNHCTTKAFQTVEKRNTVVMIATLRKQQSASTAVAHTQLFSHDCPTWHKEKELLKIKYTRNPPFFETREIVEQQSSTTNKNYASIIKMLAHKSN